MSQLATTDQTAAFADAHPHLTYNRLGTTGLRVSQAGFGSYRVDTAVPAHRQALRRALLGGVNLIDTSANYADGGSERLIGAVLAELAAEGTLDRGAAVVVSKAGYIQGQNLQLSQERRVAGRPFPDLVPVAPGLEHCIHPDFLADQLSRSLARLNLAALDVFLLHNPEYFLTWAAEEGWPLDDAREEYDRRIALAFDYLEGEAADGRIGAYGISSNTFPAPADDPAFTSLARVWQIAEAMDGHHFRVIQLPMNLFETGAATEANQPDGRSTLAFAGAHDLAVLVNRPLNAIVDGRLTRLADPPPVEPADVDPDGLIARLTTMENELATAVFPHLDLDDGLRQRLQQALAAGRLLGDDWRRFGDWPGWQEVASRALIPRVQSGVRFLSESASHHPAVSDWIDRYVTAVNETLAAVGAFYRAETAAWAAALRQQIAGIEPDWAAERLSQTAVRALRGTAGVTSVLVGMRREAYVDDVLAELETAVAVRDRSQTWQRVQGET